MTTTAVEIKDSETKRMPVTAATTPSRMVGTNLEVMTAADASDSLFWFQETKETSDSIYMYIHDRM